MDLVKLFELVKMAGVILCILFCFVFSLVFIFRYKGWSDEVVYPWEKEERRAAKKAAKEKAREKRRQEKYWREVEKQYR